MKKTLVPPVIDPEVDPTLPRTPITIQGKEYLMCLHIGALAKAEHELVKEGHDVVILNHLPPFRLDSVRVIFAASLRKYQPEIAYEDALELLTLPYVHKDYSAIADAWNNSPA